MAIKDGFREQRPCIRVQSWATALAAGIASSRPDCLANTKVWISSSAYVSGHLVAADTVQALISLGVNDGTSTTATAEHLIQLRAGVRAERVY